MTLQLNSPVKFLKGVGPKRAEALQKLGIRTVADLLYHVPHRYLDATTVTPLAKALVGQDVTCVGRVVSTGILPTRRGLRVFRAVLRDASGLLECAWPGRPFLPGVEAHRLTRERGTGGCGEGRTRRDSNSPVRIEGAPAVVRRYVPLLRSIRIHHMDVAFARAPDLAAGVGIACESCWPRRRIAGGINGAGWPRHSKEQTVCVHNEPTKVRFLQN